MSGISMALIRITIPGTC